MILELQNLGSPAMMIAGTALFWGAYTYHQDRFQPEPLRFLVLAFVLGLVAGCLGHYGYSILGELGLRSNAFELARNDRFGLLIYSIFGIGLIEELAKFLPFWIVLTRLKAFDESIDGIVYASFVAIGFASYESVTYLTADGGWKDFSRAITAPVIHATFASIWGYASSRALMRKRPLLPAAAGGLAVAALAHGLYDYVAIGVPELQAIVPPAIIGMIWIWRLDLVRRLQNEHLHHNELNTIESVTAVTPA